MEVMNDETIKQKIISKLVKGNTHMITACFDEYYFIIPEGVIKPNTRNAENYNIGDTLPVKGQTYSFPEDFTIIDLHFMLVAKVRDSKLYDVVSLESYKIIIFSCKYDGLWN